MQSFLISTTGTTPIGPLWVAVTERGELVMIEFGGSEEDFGNAVISYLQKHASSNLECEYILDRKRTAAATDQLYEYSTGARREFTIPIDWSLMPTFQRLALQATYNIRYGCTSTYQSIAAQIGHPRAARAVGRAEATNPIPLVIPCHRVLGSDGKLHGYGGPGGIQLKKWLLELERG